MQRPVHAEADVDLSLLTLVQHCTDSAHCANAAPPNQYGPTRWIVWPAAGEENTHASGAGQSVREQWRRFCASSAAEGKPLNNNCGRFGLWLIDSRSPVLSGGGPDLENLEQTVHVSFRIATMRIEASTLPSIWCSGPILEAVQSARIFNDSKDFVDSPLLVDPDECWRRWEGLQQPVAPEALKDFLEQTFGPPGGGLEPWKPPDHTAEPPLLLKLSEPEKSWARGLNDLWLVLGRQATAETLRAPERTTLLPARHGFVVPGGRFREAYYWDSYWVLLGLLAVGMRTTVGSVIDNLLDAVDVY
eukprot:6931918-Prymnesium_polylepis.1